MKKSCLLTGLLMSLLLFGQVGAADKAKSYDADQIRPRQAQGKANNQTQAKPGISPGSRSVDAPGDTPSEMESAVNQAQGMQSTVQRGGAGGAYKPPMHK
jgi:hypothetical protein